MIRLFCIHQFIKITRDSLGKRCIAKMALTVKKSIKAVLILVESWSIKVSDLNVTNLKVKHSKGVGALLKWKVFFWLGVIATIANVLLSVYQDKPAIGVLLSTLITAVLLVPYYGYAYQKALATVTLWKILLWLEALLMAFVLLFAVIGQVAYLAGEGGVSVALLGSVLILLICPLTLIPPYRYVYRSNALWNI
ncbi:MULTISPECIES: hypothetical protein [unclassified Agarivorans]|uniref:hypothetical protein n=1 Tax=unclassified Agarivorans TaxID=2636026 RepID=UPI0026E3AF69|nr:MULTISPECIES: hypothetical protein [unclassified Agarivorans]MDO6683876.1 hypothetical protein [Agarivorans sp. 3_MG-2023]MDO6714391.1 hypothetical protein [Agarivorans sp. 2_MG-2023]